MLEKTKLMKLKDKVQLLEADHPDILDENNEFPSGTDLTLNGTGDLKMKVDVGGNSTQIQYSGKNMLNASANTYSFEANTVNTKTIGTLYLEANIKYYISYNVDNNTTGSLRNTPMIQKITGGPSYYHSATDNFNTTKGRKIWEFTPSETYTYAVKYWVNSSNENVSVSDFMISTSSDITFEPYTNNLPVPNSTYKQDINNVEGDVEVKAHNKNLWDLGTYLNGFCAVRSDGSWQTGAGTSYAFETSKLPDTIIINIVNGNRSNVSYWNELPSTTKVFADYFVPNNTTIPRSFSVDKNYKYIIIQVAYNIDVNTLSNGQLEEGSTLGDYIEPQSNTVTFPLSQGQKLMLGDTLEDDGIHHKREQITLNGTEDWTKYSDNEYYVAQGKGILDNSKAGTSYIYGFCNKVTNDNDGRLLFNIIKKTTNTGGIDIQQLSSYWGFTGNNVTDFKTWLSNNPITIEYELETETTEVYTQAQQTAYNKLKEMQSYYDLTYVTGSSDNAQPILTAHAKKSIKTIGSEDLTDYVKNTDYATSSTGGVIKTASASATDISSGILQASTKTYSDYTSGQNTMFIGKGTLENVITGKGLTNVAHTNSNNNFSTAQTINGTLTVVGDISQTGTTYETHAEQLYTAKDIIKTRDGAVGGLGNNEVTGIEAIKYDGTNNGRLIFDNTGTAKVGDVGDEVPLLARDESTNMTNNYVMTWDSTNLIAKTSFGVVTLTQAQYDALVSGGTVDSNTYYYIVEE